MSTQSPLNPSVEELARIIRDGLAEHKALQAHELRRLPGDEITESVAREQLRAMSLEGVEVLK